MFIGISGGIIAAAGPGGVSYSTPEEIAQELVSPTKLTYCFLMGDSRTTGDASVIDQNCTQVVWGGFRIPSFTAYSTVGHTSSASGISSGDNPTSSPRLGGNINGWCPWASHEVEFSGTDEPGSGSNATLSRCFYPTGESQPTEAKYPNFWTYVSGKAAKFRTLAYRHGAAPTTEPGITAHWRNTGTNFGGDNVNGSYVYDYTGTGYQETSADLPDSNDWATYTSPSPELTAQPLTGTTAGEIVAFVDAWFETTAGTVLIDWSQGGRSIDGWRDDAVFASSMFTTLVPLYGANRMAWIDIGTNNPSANNQATHETLVRAHISDFRSGTPGGSVLLTCSYPSAGDSNSEPYYVPAHRSIGADQGVLFIDTWNAMPAFFDGVELGYYDVDLYTANGAHSAGAGTFVVNEAIDGGTPASGTFLVENSTGGIDEVSYSSWSSSTFTLSGTLPNNVSSGARAGVGDGVHYNATGNAAFYETIGHLIAIKAGTFVPNDIPGMFQGIYGDDVTLSGSDITDANDQGDENNDLSQGTASARPQTVVFQNGRNGFQGDGAADYIFRSSLTGGAESQPYTAFAVFKTPATGGFSGAPVGGGGFPSNRGDFTFASDKLQFYAGAQIGVATAHATDTALIAEAIADGSNGELLVIEDGASTQTATGNVGTHQPNGLYLCRLGTAAGYYSAPVAGCWRFSGRLSPERRYVMREWLKTYYDITPA